MKPLWFIYLLLSFRPSFIFADTIVKANPHTYGVELRVTQGSLYEKIGFQDRDILIAVNGKRLANKAAVPAILRELNASRKRYILTYIRHGKERELEVTVE